jgi:hypothetical protein
VERVPDLHSNVSVIELTVWSAQARTVMRPTVAE